MTYTAAAEDPREVKRRREEKTFDVLRARALRHAADSSTEPNRRAAGADGPPRHAMHTAGDAARPC